MAAREWIRGDETAKDFFARIFAERPPPLPLPPPLHRVPLRAGNVVEIVGPSPSAKSQILLEVAVNCILPKEWKGVSCGGLEQSLVFIDLDCRFDVLRLLHLLKSRISRAIGKVSVLVCIVHVETATLVFCRFSRCQTANFLFRLAGSSREGKEDLNTIRKEYNDMYDDLIEVCLKRFRYIRCYDSFEFLATLKGLAIELQSARTKLCSSVSFLMIDRRTFSLQSVSETVVNEIRNVLLLHPMLVLTTKAAIFSDKGATNDAKSSRKRYTSETLHETTVGSGSENSLYREYMPSVWQSFVTHRLVLHPCFDRFSDDVTSEQVFVAEWQLPLLGGLEFVAGLLDPVFGDPVSHPVNTATFFCSTLRSHHCILLAELSSLGSLLCNSDTLS
ncbi:DNA repair protein XRCC2-like protein [Drosera capensis]